MKRILFVIALCALPLLAQQPQEKPATKMELFLAQHGNVVFKSYTQAGSVAGLYGGTLDINAMDLRNAATGSRQKGLTFNVVGSLELNAIDFRNASTGARRQGITYDFKERDRKENTSFVDYDEIPALLEGLTYLKAVGKPAAPLAQCEAIYSTQGNLIFLVSSGQNGLSFSVKSGKTSGVTAILGLQQIDEIIAAVAKAKELLDSVK